MDFKRTDIPFIIAGPCSAESPQQVMDTFTAIAQDDRINLIRAGIWKPRTRPDSFEGVGEAGLPWVAAAKEKTGLPVTVEVANAQHVEACLNHGIDALWIGARTTANPFAVQEIAQALQGVDIPILIKNPVNPDLALWIGGIERLQKAGIKNIAAIHRGFSFQSEKYYRNKPLWQIPLELKRKHPDIPLINDPSHICGRRDILQDVAQKAMDLNFDGLMIETHIDPDKALSDAAQQINPSQLTELLDKLVLRTAQEDSLTIQSDLDKLRREINVIDDELINLLSERMRIARDIGDYKKDKNVTILQPKRWNEILNKCLERSTRSNLSEEFIEKLIGIIHDESISQQSRVFKND